MFILQFNKDDIQYWANQYRRNALEVQIETDIAPLLKSKGFLDREAFLKLAIWKSPRILPHCKSNSDAFIEAVSRIALSTTDERLRIEVLTLLDGVQWPMASVILHFGSKDMYPILDFRALQSLGLESPPDYDYKFWQAYVAFTRKLANEINIDMRTLDRALWQYSKSCKK